MKRLEILSLRKGAPLLQQAAEAWLQGTSLGVPTECGYFALDPEGDVWLACEPPPLHSPELQAAAHLVWPGPWRLRVAHHGGKRSWQVPAHPLARAFLTLTGPVSARFKGGESGEIALIWKQPCLNMPLNEVDCASHPWRWLRGPGHQRRQLEWVTGQPTILSR